MGLQSFNLSGQIALVTGASRGIGRGIAVQLAQAGATVYITGRPPKQSDSGNMSTLPTLEATAKQINDTGAGRAIAVYCDHSKDDDIKALFERIQNEQKGRLDILVNNAYAAVDSIISNFDVKFWELEPEIWDTVNNVGLRNHYFCSVYASRLMVARKTGLIVTVSSVGGLSYLFNVAYGVGKAACDRMACDMAMELHKHNVCSVSIWPGAVKTEMFQEKVVDSTEQGRTLDHMKSVFESAESPQFAGRCIAALASDPDRMRHTRRILSTGDIADMYDFTDIDGSRPLSMRSLKFLLDYGHYRTLAQYVPSWLKLPGWFMVAVESRF